MRRAGSTPRRHARLDGRPLLIRMLGLAVIVGLAVAGWQVVGTDAADHHRIAGPPPAVGDIVTKTTAVAGSVSPAGKDAVAVGLTSGVRLLSYGFVRSYGSGTDVHSAPADRRLIAFKAQPIAGDAAQQAPDLSLQIGDTERGPLVITSDYVVAAVPMTATSVALVLTDTGVKQRISLLDGKPDAGNPVVCTRIHRSATVESAREVSVRVKSSKAPAGLTSGTITVHAVELSYWGQDGSHPDAADRAYLHITATVRLAGDQRGYGAESGLLSVTTPGSSTPLRAKNAATDAATEVDDVVEVPAGLTEGVIHYSGMTESDNGSITVATPVAIPFHIAAG